MSKPVVPLFSFIEKLEDEVVAEIPSILRLDGNPTAEGILFRLLCGTIDAKPTFAAFSLNQQYNHSIWAPDELDTGGIPLNLDEVTKKYGYEVEHLSNYLLSNRSNTRTYQYLLVEFLWYFYHQQLDQHLSAFINLYRILEHMAFALPSIYFARFNASQTSMELIKNFFGGGNDGHLAFLNQISKKIFWEYEDFMVKLECYAEEKEGESINVKVLESLCKDVKGIPGEFGVEVSMPSLISVMITLRNRYCHFQSDRKQNIDSLGFRPDLFFEPLNFKFANILSLFFYEIVLHGVRRVSYENRK